MVKHIALRTTEAYEERIRVRTSLLTLRAVLLGGRSREMDATPEMNRHSGDDPGERFDIAAEHPDVLQDLMQEARRYRESVAVKPSVFDARPPGG